MKHPTSAPAIIVIGTTAGGLDALKDFFHQCEILENCAIVIAQHLENGTDALAVQTIQRITKLPVELATEKSRVEGNRVFVVPPMKLVSFHGGTFELRPTRTPQDNLSVIDRLFDSAAEEFGKSTVGIILSGDGTDGGQGLRMISEAGGYTLAQTPHEALHPSMPSYAVSLGFVDHVGPVRLFCEEIRKFLEFQDGDGPQTRLEIEENLDSICELLRAQSHQDFRHYKSSTLVRRIQRRMQVIHARSVDEYLSRLRDDPEEAGNLFKELLINVTSFFRDRSSFQTLKTEVIDKLIAASPVGEKVRVWVAGCSTGEEAYTMAILFSEAAEKLEKPPEIQIIATDIDENALGVARKGTYHAGIAETIPAEYLDKYFQRKNGKYYVKKEIREVCLFSSHNLINDPPFSQIDLISCRNVLIYFGPHLQQKLIPIFHYALRPNGFLFLGNSESVTGHSELFKTISAKDRIAQRKATAVRSPSAYPINFRKTYAGGDGGTPGLKDPDLHLVGQRILLDEFAPRYAIVSEDQNILSLSEGMDTYLVHPVGAFDATLSKLIRPDLRVALRSTFREAQKEKRKVQHAGATFKRDQGVGRVRITVQPMPQLGTDDALFMVVFSDLGTVADVEASPQISDGPHIDFSVVEQLEKELAQVRGDLDRTVQDLEASNEELKSSNEELLSMNEELQSANEELEASKEEVQSANDSLRRSNTDLENLLSSTQIATLFIGEDYKIKSFTPAVAKIYNVLDRDIGRSLLDLSHKAVNLPPYPDPSQPIAEGSTDDAEVMLGDGHVYLRRILPYKTDANKQDGLVVTFTEVSELRKREGMFQAIANTIPALVWTTDARGAADYFNSQWYDYTGLSAQNSLGDHWLIAVGEAQRNTFARDWRKALAGEQPFQTDVQLQARNGSLRWFAFRVHPVKTYSGTVIKWVGSFFDIDDERKLENALRIERSVAETANQLKSSFLANMSHEIRTPLGAILGFTELLKSAKLSPEEHEYVSIISRNGIALTKVIDDILDLSKVEAGKLSIELVPFPVTDLIQEVVLLFSDIARSKGIGLHFRSTVEAGVRIISDPTRIRQILINLVGNAVKFTTQGTVTVTLRMEKIAGGSPNFQVLIRDTGPGITKEQQDRIFQPFMQGDNNTNRKYGGTGLGLILSRKLASALGGDVRLLSSRQNEGSEFVLELQAEITAEKSADPMNVLGDFELNHQALRGLRLLVVDDSPDNRMLISLFLRRQGAQTEEAIGGAEAVERALAESFDLILMDIQMPGVDGYEALRSLRAKGFTKPVVALTAHAMKEEMERTRRAGFVAHLTKPIHYPDLVATILRLTK